jgi:ADP-heptose:LPS heptosyltransferase
MQIVIRIPDTIEERIASFPFIKALRNHFLKEMEESEEEVKDELGLHLVTEDKNVDVLYLLPFNAFYHEFPKNELKNIFNIHRTAVNLKVPKVDYFFSLTDSLADATMGLSLKATKRIGFITPKTKMMYHHGLERMEGSTLVEQYMSLMRPLVDGLMEPPTVVSRELEAIVEEYGDRPYFVVNVPMENDEIPTEWIEFIEFFDKQRIFIMCDAIDKGEEQVEYIKEKLGTLTSNSEIKIINHNNIIEWGKLVSYASFFVSPYTSFTHIAAFCSCVCYVIGAKPSGPTNSLNNYTGDIRFVTAGDPDFSADGKIDLGQLFDYLQQKYFNQTQTPSA